MTDARTVLLVVVLLGLLAVGGLCMGFVLVYQGKGPVPDFIIGTTGLAAGAVAGILAKTSTGPPAEG